MYSDRSQTTLTYRCAVIFLTFALAWMATGCDKQAPAVPDKGESEATATANNDQDTGDRAEENPANPDDEKISLLTDPDSPVMSPELAGEYPIDKIKNYDEKGDLSAIAKHGKLRILVDIGNIASLHRAATRQDLEIDQARRLAARLGLDPVVLHVNNFSQLIEYLVQGKGDIIANDLVITDERKALIDFSTPVANTRLVLVSHNDTPDIDKQPDLKGKVLAVTRGTVFEEKAKRFANEHPELVLKVVDTNYVDLAVEVAQKDIDFTILDDAALSQTMQFRDELKKNHVFPEPLQIAWAIRKDSPELMKAINDKIRHIKLTRSTKRVVDDLDKIKKRGVLRAITRNNPGSYYMWKGRVLGYEFELLEAFAKDQDLRLEVIVVPDHASFIQMLEDGKADVAANLLAPTERRKSQGMTFSSPTHMAKVGVVSLKKKGDEGGLETLSDLSGRTVYLREGSSHFDLFQKIKEQVPGVNLELVPENLDIQQIFDHIATGEYDVTFSDDITVNMERSWRDDLHFDLDLNDDHPHSWMVRDNNPKLLKAINHFLEKKKTIEKRAQLYKKYFDSPRPSRDEIMELNAKGEISPFDGLVQKYAKEFDFDWRLVIAQMFQESSFNPKAKSWVGARGLMQVMPDTGKQVGEKNLFDPETSVRAGMKYLEWLYRKFEDKQISPENMMWFTLASYNAGLGHVYDAQDLAEEKGWDRKVWFGNVENAMLLLSQKKYYRKARYGYARGREPYDYVRKIEARFRTYVALLDAHKQQSDDVTLAFLTLPGALWQPARLAHKALRRRRRGNPANRRVRS